MSSNATKPSRDECGHRKKKRVLDITLSPNAKEADPEIISVDPQYSDDDSDDVVSRCSDVPDVSPNASGVEVLNDAQAHLMALQDILAEKSSKVPKDQQLRVSRSVSEVFRAVAQLLLEREAMRADLVTVTAQLQIARGETRCEREQNKHLNEKILQLESDLGPVMRRVAVATEASLSYADIARNEKAGPPPITRTGIHVGSPKPSVCIFPKLNKAQDSEQTKQLMKDTFRPSELGVRVTGVRKIKNNGVLLQTATKDDLNKILNAPALVNSSTLSARLPAKRLPRVIFFNVPRELTDDGFLRSALTGISGITDVEGTTVSCKFSHLAGARTGPTCHRVYEVPANLRHVLVEQGKVFVDWTVCRVRDFIGLTVCSKCQMLGHSFKFCKDQTRCGHCGQDGHARDSCPNTAAKAVCATCTRFGKPAAHPTGDRENCPAYLAALSRDFSTISYGV